MIRLRYAFALVALALLGDARARAGYEFQFATDAGVATNAFNINFPVLPTVDVRVYLLATGAADINTLRTVGLESYGVKLSWSAGAEAQVVNLNPGVTGNAAFDGGDTEVLTATSATINGLVNFAPTTFVRAGPAEDRILLATFRFTGLANGTSTTLTADPNPTFGVDDTVLADGGIALDALIGNSTAQITVTNVPEPGTMALTGLLASGIAGAALRRSRRPAPAAAA